MLKKKATLLTTAAMAVFLATAGCSSGQSSKGGQNEKVTIQMCQVCAVFLRHDHDEIIFQKIRAVLFIDISVMNELFEFIFGCREE